MRLEARAGVDRLLHDHLERTQAELKTAQTELTEARRQIASLQAVVEAQEQAAKAAADVRDQLAAAMTTKFRAIPSSPSAYAAIATVLLIGFVLMLVIV